MSAAPGERDGAAGAAGGAGAGAAGAAGAAGGPDAGRRLVDEALRLVEAFRETGPDAAGAVPGAGFAAHTGPECRVCPVCRVIAAVRTLRPEAVEHLAVAAAELANAWREVVAGGAPAEPAAPPPRREPSVEHIDVTD